MSYCLFVYNAQSLKFMGKQDIEMYKYKKNTCGNCLRNIFLKDLI